MKTKATLTAILLSAANMAWASGGVNIDNVEQHMNANSWIKTQAEQTEITVQAPVDKFRSVSVMSKSRPTIVEQDIYDIEGLFNDIL